MSGASDAKYLNSCLVFLLAKDLVAQIRMLAGGILLCGSDWPWPAFSPLMDIKLDGETEEDSGHSQE